MRKPSSTSWSPTCLPTAEPSHSGIFLPARLRGFSENLSPASPSANSPYEPVLAEQGIQRYEASTYAGVSFARLVPDRGRLGLTFHYDVRLSQAG